MIELIELTKRFGQLVAVDHINLHVKQGEIFGFLGPNGAGKTTTIKMLAGLLKPTSGRALVDGYDVVAHPMEAKRVIGLIPDQPFLYEKLTGVEFLRFIGSLFGMKKDDIQWHISHLLDLFELDGWGDELIESYSHGMKQRLVMSAALLHDPKVIIVDEPMVGLDPKAINLVKRIFKQKSEEGVTIFLSTHTLEIAQQLCHRLGILNGGKLIAMGTLSELMKTLELETGRTGTLESLFLTLTGKALND
ncbi:MAG: ABC transporter ATP-binding protein [Syntrophobacterales bacterium]|nr:MAG: ABC transporter ATP-binding protein [Syntrophobacterales bacterium]